MEETNPRLGVNDKRHLFQSLLAMAERLLYLNKFPVDMGDFALSLQPIEVEAAWKLLNQQDCGQYTRPTSSQRFRHDVGTFLLHEYPNTEVLYVFMDVRESLDIDNARRHSNVVSQWCVRQARLEEQILRSAKVIKAIVHSCNTVGQYKRVSPDLLTFLPDKYKDALRDYTKQSPYPAITVDPQEIDTTLSTLAYASLQPTHKAEEEFARRPKWNNYGYNLDRFPRGVTYDSTEVRRLEL